MILTISRVLGRHHIGAPALKGVFENTLRGGVNRYMANLMTNDAELKTNCNTLSVIKECSRIPGEGL